MFENDKSALDFLGPISLLNVSVLLSYIPPRMPTWLSSLISAILLKNRIQSVPPIRSWSIHNFFGLDIDLIFKIMIFSKNTTNHIYIYIIEVFFNLIRGIEFEY